MGPTFYRKGHFSSIAALLLLRHSSIAAAHNRKESAAIEEKWPFLLRRSSIAAPRSRKGSATIRALLYAPLFWNFAEEGCFCTRFAQGLTEILIELSRGKVFWTSKTM